jgi:signal peptidase I
MNLSFRVASDSMAPILKTGDILQIDPVKDPQSLKRFDIVVFKSSDRLICHFLWSHNHIGNEPSFSTRSLLNPWVDDAPSSYSFLVGKVRGYRVPVTRRLLILLTNFLRGTL